MIQSKNETDSMRKFNWQRQAERIVRDSERPNGHKLLLGHHGIYCELGRELEYQIAQALEAAYQKGTQVKPLVHMVAMDE